MNNLKPLQIKNAPLGKHADGGGLYFVKTKAGAKWIYRYSFGDRRREMGLGSYPVVTLAEARRERDKWAEHLRSGVDPITERDHQRQIAADEMNREDPTLEDLALLTLDAKKAGFERRRESRALVFPSQDTRSSEDWKDACQPDHTEAYSRCFAPHLEDKTPYS